MEIEKLLENYFNRTMSEETVKDCLDSQEARDFLHEFINLRSDREIKEVLMEMYNNGILRRQVLFN